MNTLEKRHYKKHEYRRKKVKMKEEMKKWTTIDSKNRMKLIITEAKIFKRKLKKEWTSRTGEAQQDIYENNHSGREKSFQGKHNSESLSDNHKSGISETISMED